MMKRTLYLLGICVLLLQLPLISAIAQEKKGPPMKEGNLIVCGDDKVRILDGREALKGKAEYVWEWQASEAKGQLPDEYFDLLASLDDCKPIRRNKQLLVTSSSGASLIIEVASKRILFYAKTPMAHSADLLPGGRIAVANSTHEQGNSLEVYDQRWPEKVLFKDTLYSGHGVVWAGRRNELVALGYDSLLVYRLKNWDSPTPVLEKVRAYRLPDEGGHELSQIDQDRFLVSTHHHVWTVDITGGTFLPFLPLSDRKDIKSANYDAKTKGLVYTIAEESWWTHHVYGKNPAFSVEIPDMKVYKVRVVQ